MCNRLVVLVLLLAGAVARADTLEMKGGGVLEGDVVAEGEAYRVVLPSGADALVPAADVARVTRGSTWRDEYIRRLNTTDRTDAEALYRLGLFCADHSLRAEAAVLFRECVDAVPSHAGARAALGEVLFEGEWMSREEAARRRGQVEFAGKFVSPDEKAALEWAARVRRARTELRRLAARLRSADPAARAQAAKDLAAVADPAAIEGLLELSAHWHADVRAATAAPLARIAAGYATLAPAACERLARLADHDQDVDVQDAAVAAIGDARLAAAAESLLRDYGSSEEAWVRNAAAHALGTIRWKAAFAPLVATLTYDVKRQKMVPAAGLGALALGQYTEPGYAGGVGHGRALGRFEMRVVDDVVFNDAARAALRDLCGEDHDFDRAGWQAFFAREGARRDAWMRLPADAPRPAPAGAPSGEASAK
jgi:hypothetical protein